MTKLDVDSTRLLEIADLLLAYTNVSVTHMQAVQQAHRMKLAIGEMESSTAYIVYDFKQKFLAKGFQRRDDPYYTVRKIE